VDDPVRAGVALSDASVARRSAGMRLHDWTGFAALAAAIASLVAIVRGDLAWAGGWLAAAGVAGVVTRWWSVTHPGPMPHLLRWTLFVPRGSHAPARLVEILEPRGGERMLEIGPGVGIHSVPVAAALAPGGSLDVVDVQPAMLDDVVRRARTAGVTNVTPHRADARRLPFADATFDGAYLIGVLGEIPDGDAALREIHRVLKPEGRLVVGEVLFDPDFVSLGTLAKRTRAAAFDLERRVGGRASYLARFRRL
jgi:SAM-dependent methyltransferase